MKSFTKILLLVALLLVSFVAPVCADDIAINETNFPDANFRSFLLEQSYGKDGVLTESEIQEITLLNVSDRKISSLQGIEFFTALKTLECYSNQLTSLDVSKNTALTILSCDNNQLTSLDVSKNTALHWLFCRSNQLASLDVSKNISLDNLDGSINSLTSLDVSQNTALTYLNCGFNQLTSLDVSNNTALDVLRCSENQLTALDVSKNTALTELSCNDNQLTSLDVSKNAALTELICHRNQLTTLDVSQNTALTDLFCTSNNLTTLDISQNKALKTLDCSVNSLTSLDVSQNIALEYLYCWYNQLTSLDASDKLSLKELTCFGNQLTTLDVSNNTALDVLRCSENQLTSLDVSNCTALRGLDCNYNQLTSLDVSQNTALTMLGCYTNKINGENMDDLIGSLPKNETEEEHMLYVIDNRYGNEENVCTKSQVAVAKDKGWTPYYYDTTENEWKEYEGSDEEIDDIFVAETIEGVEMTFRVLSHEGKVCQVGTGEEPAIDTSVAGSVTIPTVAEGYTVINIGDRAFQDCGSLLYVSIPESVTNIEGHETFMGCNSMAALKWDAEEWLNIQPLHPLAENPNLLLYVKKKDYAPEMINNVVVNGVAENITLQDAFERNNFYCPLAFKAKNISYTHNYSMTSGYKTCQGWESIVLPFDVTSFTNKHGAKIVTFAHWQDLENECPFWLRTLTEDGWLLAADLKANTPYIISMPNNEMYDDKYNIGSKQEGEGDITFLGVDVEVQASENLAVGSRGNQRFVPRFQALESSEEVYALNVNNLWDENTESSYVEGSAFIRNLRNVRPFEAYLMVEGSGSRAVPIVFDEETTGIDLMRKSQVTMHSDVVYDLQGRKVTTALRKGIYVVNGRKFVVK